MKPSRADEEITQQIRVGREALDAAVNKSAEAMKRLQSSIPPSAPDAGEQESEGAASYEPDPEDEDTKR